MKPNSDRFRARCALAFGASLLVVVGLVPPTMAKPQKVPPPVLASADVEDRIRECLVTIVREFKPDPQAIAALIKSKAADPKRREVMQKRGLNIMASRWDKSPHWALACLATGEDVSAANDIIARYSQDYPINKDEPQDAGDVNPKKLLRAALLPEIRARLTPASLAAIEEAAYAFVYKRSIIDPKAPNWNNAAKSVWYMSGSENHDSVQKSANLFSLQFLCRSGKRYNAETKLADGRPAREHYAKWVAYWKEYTRQRAREGIFCEVAEPGSYGRATIGTFFDLYDLSEDAELRRLGKAMLDLHFAQLASEFEPKTGTRGAIAITRAKDSIDQQFGNHWTKVLTYAWGWHDAPGDQINESHSTLFTTRYRPPAIITAIARGPRPSPFFSTMRCPGLGGEKVDYVNEVLFADGPARNSHLRRTSWVTPEYMLSGLTSDPARSYLAVSSQCRIAGITFSSGVNDRITILGYDTADAKGISFNAINTLPWRDVLIAGRDPSGKTQATCIYVANGVWKSRVEGPDGWNFLQAGDGYCALRVVSGGFKLSPAPHNMGARLTLEDIDSPMVFQLGRAAEYPGGFAAFQKAVAGKTKLEFAGNHLRYRSLAGDDLGFWVKEKRLPELAGKPFPLNPPETYATPFLTMTHGTDVSRVKYPGHPDVVLDFKY